MSDQVDPESSSERRKHSTTVQCTRCGHWLHVAGRRKRSSKSLKNKGSQPKSKSLPSENPKIEGKASVPSIKWAMFFGACLSGIIFAGGFSFWYIAYGKDLKRPLQEDRPVVNKIVKREGMVGAELENQSVQSSPVTAAIPAILSRYFKAGSWKERLSLVRKTPRIEEKMENWYARHEDVPFVRVALDKSITEIGGYYVVKLHGDGLPSDHIVIEKTQQGYLVDWESFVIYQEQDWGRIQEEKSKEVRVIRCMLEPVKNNHQKLTAEKGYKCYKLTHPITGKVMLAYFNAHSFNQNDSKSVRALGEVSKGRYTIGVNYLDQDLMIARILAKGWVIR